MERFRNPNGNYDGAAFFAELTGIPKEEILWMAKRTKELLASGVGRHEAVRRVKLEAAQKPWESAQ